MKPLLLIAIPIVGSILGGCAIPGAQVKFPESVSQPVIFGKVAALPNATLPETAKKVGSFKGEALDFFASNSATETHGGSDVTITGNNIAYNAQQELNGGKNRCVSNLKIKVSTSYMPTALKSKIKVSGDVYELPEGQAK
jgi:hypothetical protein